MTEQQVIRDRVLFGPGVTIVLPLLAIAVGVGLVVHAYQESVEVLFAVPELWVLPLLLVLALGTRFGSQKLCRVEIGEKELVGRRFSSKRAYVRWSDMTGVVITENRIEFSTPFSYVEITRAFGRFDEIADFVRRQCVLKGIKCRDEPEQRR
jgi:hypothetical protein